MAERAHTQRANETRLRDVRAPVSGWEATQCDDGNPKSLSAMTEQQKNRAVSVLYKNTAKFAVAFAISASPKGRNLLFGLGDTLSGGCRV